MNTIAISIILLAVSGAVFGLILAFASKKMAVESDPRVAEIVGVLPGANCGGCGFAGCGGLAEAIVAGTAPVNACPVGKSVCAAKIAAIMGLEVTEGAKPQFAKILCQGGKGERVDRFYYMGVPDCAAAGMLNGGYKQCEFGCLGLGNCVRACPFDALVINDNELPEVDEAKCTGCGACVKACPRSIISLVDADNRVMVLCKSHDKGAEVRKACKVGCIGCGICVKNCPEQAIVLADNLAVINPDQCTACGICVQKCPMKTIKFSETAAGTKAEVV